MGKRLSHNYGREGLVNRDESAVNPVTVPWKRGVTLEAYGSCVNWALEEVFNWALEVMLPISTQ